MITIPQRVVYLLKGYGRSMTRQELADIIYKDEPSAKRRYDLMGKHFSDKTGRRNAQYAPQHPPLFDSEKIKGIWWAMLLPEEQE